MANNIITVPKPQNEPVLPYGPGSPEKAALKAELKRQPSEEIEIPLLIGGKEVRTGNTAKAVCPHDHQHVLATYHQAGQKEVEMAIAASQETWHDWSEMPWESRAAIFLKAAELLAGPMRAQANAATMLNQSKTVFQAEIDSACELIDFYRFNPYYMRFVYDQQPDSAKGIWDYAEYRALEGFIFAVTPFNFTSIAGNLPTSPAMMGNTVLWKPASSAVFSAYHILKVLQAAGVPDGVINFVPGRGGHVGDPVLAIFVLDVIDDFAAALLAEIDVEVGHRGAFRIEEPLEEESVAYRVDIGDAGAVGDQRSGPRSAAGTDRHGVLFRPADEVGDDGQQR